MAVMVVESASSEAPPFSVPLTSSTHPATDLITPSKQLNQNLHLKPLGWSRTEKPFCICSSGHTCSFHQSLLNSRAHTSTYGSCSSWNVFPFEIHPLQIGGAGVSHSSFSIKPQPLPWVGALDGGFGASGLQGLSCHYLSAYSMLNCNPNIGSGPEGKTLKVFRSFNLEPLILKQVSVLRGDAGFTCRVMEKWRWWFCGSRCQGLCTFYCLGPLVDYLHGPGSAASKGQNGSSSRPGTLTEISPILRLLVTRLN